MRMVCNTSLLTLLLFNLATSVYAQTPRTPPAAYNTSTIKVNYVRSWSTVKPVTDATTLTLGTASTEAQVVTQYLDGLGRPLQEVVKKGSLVTGASVANDFVKAVEYDPFGREVYNYLPFVSSTNDGLMKPDAFLQQGVFAQAQYPNEQFFYGKTVFEPSPLNRIDARFAAGDSWMGSEGTSSPRSQKQIYGFNTAADDVRIWKVVHNGVGNWGDYATNSGYTAGELAKTIAVDESGKQVIEFKDKKDRLILRKVQIGSNIDNGSGLDCGGFLCTYYIYDDLGQLRCVVQPNAVDRMNSTTLWTLSTTMLDELCFRYEYDDRSRMIMKKVPGAAEVYMVYDARDRLVMSQDGNMRLQGKWTVMQYDALNRPTVTLLWDNTTAFATHRSNASVSSAYPTLSGTYEELTTTFYDSYSWLSSYTTGLGAFSTTDNTYWLSASATTYPYPETPVQSTAVKGMVTGTRTKVLGENSWLYSVSYFDDKGRVIQVQTSNISGGIDVVTNQYAFSGLVVLNVIRHQKAGTNAASYVMITKPTYDDLGRVVKTEKKLSTETAFRTVSELEYDALGQLKKKKLAPAYNGNAGLETLSYDYNIRGWMLGANRDYAKSNSTDHYFGFDLGYDKTSVGSGSGTLGAYTTPQYGGNISGSVWKSKGDNEIRKYDFTYDAANRLTGADFNQYTSSSFNKTAGIDFSVSNLTYDQNGNIFSMWQKGWMYGGSDFIDKLAYTYSPYSNKLRNVIDDVNNPATKLGDFRSSQLYMSGVGTKTASTTDYVYDANGNLVKDRNKDIETYGGGDGIEYNFLNLPKKITVKASGSANKGTIEYVYDAGGNKLKKIVTEGSTVTTTLYMYGTYENDALQFLPQEEGRVRPLRDDNGAIVSYAYDYMLKDHLGNVRVLLTDEDKTDYYPAATMEEENKVVEEALYGNVGPTYSYKTADIPGYNAPTTSEPNDYVARVIGEDHKIGPNIILKVMAGDKVNILANSWYDKTDFNGGSNVISGDLIETLSNGIAQASNGKVSSSALAASTSSLSTGILSFLSDQDNSFSTTSPMAAVTWILFDEQFKLVASSSGFDQVGDDEVYKTHTLSDLVMSKNGYLFVYVSNVSETQKVYFDNLQVTHIHGPILEETHYYPFGLTMAGISSKRIDGFSSIGKIENLQKFNDGTQLNSAFDINLYETPFRGYDPQIGRFWQVDPLCGSSPNLSVYNFASNNPVLRNDPTGLKDSIAPNKTLEPVYVISLPRTFWGKQRFYYEVMDILNSVGAKIDQLENENLRDMMMRFDNISKHRDRVAEMTRASDIPIYGTLFAPLIGLFVAEVAGPLAVEGGEHLIRVGNKLIPWSRIVDVYQDVSLEIYFRGNIALNNLRSEILAAFAGTFLRDNPAKWEKVMNQSGAFKDLMAPVLKFIEKQGNKNDGGIIPKHTSNFKL